MSLPVHWREVIKKTSEELSIPEVEVKLVVLFYWKYFKKEMASLNRTKVSVVGLGTFHIKPWKVLSKINKLTIRIRSERNHGGRVKKIRIYRKHQEELRILKGIYIQIQKELGRKTKVRKKQKKMRDQYYPVYQKSLLTNEVHNKIKSDLEKQKEDSARSSVHMVSE